MKNQITKALVLTMLIFTEVEFVYSNPIDSSAFKESYYTIINRTLEDVSISSLNTNYFIDKAPPIFDPNYFNGLSINDSNYVDYFCFWRAYSVYQISSIQQNLPSADDFKQTIQSVKYSYENANPLLFIFNDCDKIRKDAITMNLLNFVDGKLIDVENRADSPFETKRSFIGTTEGILFEGLTQRFVFNNRLFISNIINNVSTISIDFGNGEGFMNVTNNVPIEVQYSEPGTKHIVYKILYNSIEYITHSIIKISSNTSNIQSSYTFNLEAEKAYNGQWASAKIDIIYACGRNELRKPLIIIEGIDPPQNVQLGLTNHDYYFNYFYLQQSSQFINFINLEEYDLVFVDFKNGSDYIQKNAYLVETLLKRINSMKSSVGSVEKNVVMGLSMGGLVGRYALRDMEINNLNHDTRLFISFDSPNLGANTPLGMQHLIDHTKKFADRITSNWVLNNAYSGLKEAMLPINLGYEIGHSPASRQMLIYQSHGAYDEYADKILYDNFYHEINNVLGMPQNCRNIAIVNGSGKGLDITAFNDGEKLFKFNSTNSLFSTIWYEKAGLFLLSIFGTGIYCNADVYALNNAYNTNIYTGNFTVNFLDAPIIQDVRLKYKPYYIQSIDNAPGSYFELSLIDNSSGSVPVSISEKKAYFTFIPSISSIMLNTPYRSNYNFNIVQNNVVSTGKTPFNSAVYAIDNNLNDPYDLNNRSHVSLIPQENDVFLMDEMLLNRTNAFNTNQFNSTNNYYNFTNHTTNKLNSAEVKQGGYLLFNNNVPSGFANSNLPLPSMGNINVTSYYQYNCLPTSIINNSGGTIILGDLTNPSLTAEVIIASKLVLKSGSTLIVNNNSKLIIAKGAELIVESGAIVKLQELNSILQIEGKLIIPDNQIFTKQGLGFIKFRGMCSESIILGLNSKFIYSGSGYADKVIEVENGQGVVTGNTNSIFEINNALIKFTNGTLVVHSSINFNGVKSWGNGNGLIISGNNSVSINECDFYSTKRGIEIYYTNSNGAVANIINSRFYGLEEQDIKIYGRGFNISNCVFNESNIGIYAQNFNTNSTIESCNIRSFPDTAIYLNGSAIPIINCNNLIIGNDNPEYPLVKGMVLKNCKVTLNCSQIYSKETAIHMGLGAILDMSNSNSSTFGNNLISKVQGENDDLSSLIKLDGATQLYLENGFNSLKKDSTSSIENLSCKFISGNLSPASQIILAKNNFWYPESNSINTLPNSNNRKDIVLHNTSIKFSPIAIEGVYDNPCLSSFRIILDPCADLDQCNNSFDLLNSCTECNNVKVNGIPINMHLKRIIKDIRKDTLHNNSVSNFLSLDTLLNVTVNGNKPKVDLIKDRALYLYLNEYNLIEQDTVNIGIRNIANTKLKEKVNNRLIRALNRNDTSRIINSYLLSAHIFLRENNHINALNQFDNALSYLHSNTLNYMIVEEQRCLVQIEDMFENNQINDSIRIILMNSCKPLESISNKPIIHQDEITLNQNLNIKNVNTYPNPANNTLRVLLENFEGGNVEIIVYDLLGREIIRQYEKVDIHKINLIVTIDVSSFSNGSYIIVVKDQEFEKRIKQIIFK